MDGNEMRKMSAEYRQHLREILASGWSVLYVGLSDFARGGPNRYGIKPGHVMVIASKRSRSLGEVFTVALGIGAAEGKKMDVRTAADFLRQGFQHQEHERAKQKGGGIVVAKR